MIFALAISLCSVAGVSDASAAPLAQGVASICITVEELDRSVAFFGDVLDFKLESRAAFGDDLTSRVLGIEGAKVAIATLRLGDARVQLMDFLSVDSRPIPNDSRSNDRWFQHIAIVTTDMDRAYARLTAAGAQPASIAPQTLPAWNPTAGGIRAYYFKDPDNHVLEIIQFPNRPGSEQPVGTTADTPLFTGIDHTAIVTADTDRSVQFYQGVLGLQVVGRGENYGLEQERLNNVFGAHLRITTLRATSGPGIELLEYLTPSTGREYPRDSTPADLWHWHVTITSTQPLADAQSRLSLARAAQISAAPASPDQPLPALLVRDPDGHAIQFQP